MNNCMQVHSQVKLVLPNGPMKDHTTLTGNDLPFIL